MRAGFRSKIHPQLKGRQMQIESTLKYLVIQIHPVASPRMGEVQSNFLTGDGVLVAATADGYYANREVAQGVAGFFSERHPHLTTHVVEVLSTKGGCE